MNFIRMDIRGSREKFLFQQIRFQPRPARFVKQSEVIRHNDELKIKNAKGILTPQLFNFSFFSRAETFAAGTARRGVWVFHFETAVERVQIIQFAAGHIQRAFGIHHHAHAAAFDEDVPIRRRILQIHFILQTRAAAADDGHAQNAICAALFGQQRGNFARRIFCELDEPLIADAKIWLRRILFGDIGNHSIEGK